MGVRQETCLAAVNKISEAGEDEAADGEEEHQQAELLYAVLQSVGDGLDRQ